MGRIPNYAFPGTSCLATIVLSLRDKVRPVPRGRIYPPPPAHADTPLASLLLVKLANSLRRSRLLAVVPLTRINEKRGNMQKGFLLGLILFCLSTGGALAQEFTTTPRVRPQPIPPRPAIEDNSNSSVLHKVFTTRNRLQLINPGAPASYGSGSQVILASRLDAINNRPERPNVIKFLSFDF
jgi:hypothetical protein